MSEAMTSELIIEAAWLLEGGYWTKMRYAFQTDNGAWSDVDVIAYNPETRHLVICESKVQGPKDYVYAYNDETHKKWKSIVRFDRDNYFSFIRHFDVLRTH